MHIGLINVKNRSRISHAWAPLNVYSSVGKLTSLKFLRSKYLLPPQNPSWKGLPASFPPFLRHFFCYLKLADTIARYKNRNLKPKNRIGRLKNRNSKRTDTIGRYKNRNLKPKNRIGRLKNRNSNRTDTIGRFKNRNLASTDCIVRYNRKIESVSEDRSIGPFAHLCLIHVLKPLHF